MSWSFQNNRLFPELPNFSVEVILEEPWEIFRSGQASLTVLARFNYLINGRIIVRCEKND